MNADAAIAAVQQRLEKLDDEVEQLKADLTRTSSARMRRWTPGGRSWRRS
jgi:prefoldin subunit 5